MMAEQPVDPFLPIEEALQRLVDDLDKLDDSKSSPDELESHPEYYDPLVDERARIMATVGRVAIFMQSVRVLADKKRERPLMTLRPSPIRFRRPSPRRNANASICSSSSIKTIANNARPLNPKRCMIPRSPRGAICTRSSLP